MIAAEALTEKGGDVSDLGGETVAGKRLLDAGHAQLVPMIFFHRLFAVFGNFVHVEKADANTAAGDAANFANGGLEAGH